MAGSVMQIRSIPAGLNYAAIRPTAGLMGVKITSQMFDWLHLMEVEALQAFREQR